MARAPISDPKRRSTTVPAASRDISVPASITDPGNIDDRVDPAPHHLAIAVVEHMSPLLPGLTPDDVERLERYVGKASADATKRAYTSDWRILSPGAPPGRSPLSPRRPPRWQRY